MQDKGNASSALLCICLHIVLSRDMPGRLRDRFAGNGGIAWVIGADRETLPHARACRL